MNMSQAVIVSEREYPIELAISAWLDAKGKLSGSAKTRRAYSDTLASFRHALQRVELDLTSPARDVATVMQVWAGRDATGQRDVSPNTYNQRIACISSFYSFARKRQMLHVDNPTEMLERRKVQAYAGAVPMSKSHVASSLQAIDRGTLLGKRDYALLTVALGTARRLSEVASLTLGDVAVEGTTVTLTFQRMKGGKSARNVLPNAAGKELLDWLTAFYGSEWQQSSDVPVWVSLAHDWSRGKTLSTRSISEVCEKRLGTSKVHALRHTFAHVMEESGAKVSEIQAALGHSSLATTGIYLRALSSGDNPHAETGVAPILWKVETVR
jgi:site-specific recombinase XerD